MARARVLYLDDTPERFEVQSLVERDTAFRLDTVTTPDDALSALATTSYDCVVTDLDVGDSSPHELATTLNDAAPETPLVAYTAIDVTHLAPDTRDVVTTIVQKAEPIHRRFLLAKVQSVLGSDESRYEALSDAFTDVHAVSFLVAADGSVEMSSTPFADFFPVAHLNGTTTGTLYDRLVRLFDNGATYHERLTDARATGDPLSGFVGVVTLPGGEKRSFACWSLPFGSGKRLEFYRDVTAVLDRYEDLDKFETLVELAHDGLGVVDANGRFAYCNEAYADLLGYDREELVGEQTYAMFAEGALRKGQRITQEVLEDPEERSQVVEIPHSTKDGDRVWLAIHAAVLPRSDGTYGGLVNVARDVTEQRELERALRDQRERLQQQNDHLETLAAEINEEFRETVEAADRARERAIRSPEQETFDEIENRLTRIREQIDETLVVEREDGSGAIEDELGVTFETEPLEGVDGEESAEEPADANAEQTAGDEHSADEASVMDTRLHVLHVDGDPQARERVSDTFADEPDIESESVGSVGEAIEALSTGSYGCLVVDFATLSCGPDKFDSTVPAAGSEVPMVVFTSDPPADLYDQFAGEEATVVEKGGAANRSFFVQKVRSLTGIGQYGEVDIGWQTDLSDGVGDEGDVLGVLLADGHVTEATADPTEFFGTPAVTTGSFRDGLADVFANSDRFERWLDSTDGSLLCVQPRVSDDRYVLCLSHSLARDCSLIVFRDVTAEVERRDRLNQARTLVEQARDGIHVVDEQAVMVYCNQGLSDRVGYDREELIGEDVTQFTTGESLQRGQQKVQELIENPDKESALVEIVERQKGGEHVLTAQRFTLTPFDDDGSYTGLMSVSRDITERRERRKRLRRQQRRLERKNQLLERFGSIVSHDLRNPLGIAETYLSFARESHDEADLQAVADALDRMREMLDELLSFARMGGEIDERTTVDLAPLTSDAWDTVAPEKGNLSVECETTAVSADRAKLQHVFENLFRNSVEHGTKGGPDSDGEPVDVRVGTLTDRPGFFVADDGPGISANERGDVFAYGYSSEGGTGIGLAIVKDVVEAHGWEISITESTEGGARFEIAI